MKLLQPVPILRMMDEAKAREFYVDFLGFSVDFEHRFADNAPLYMQIRRSGCTLHLSEHHGDAVPGGALRIEVDDVDALNRELVEKHYKYANPGVADTPWRTREMTIKDPFGNRLVFTQPRTIVLPSFDAGELRGAMTAVGLTARWVAAARALETECEEPLYRDPLARDLAGPAGFALMNAMRAALGLVDSARPESYLTIRTKYLDDALLEAVVRDRLTQVVILAAGMDARAFRLDWPSGVTVFEIDRDDIFDYKEPLLAARGARAACGRRVVRADLAQSWVTTLTGAGFDPGRPAAFLIEGLLMYLDEADANGVLESVSSVAAPGSWIGLDAVNTHMLTAPYMAAYMNRLAEAGCPWTFGVDDPAALLSRFGWRATVVSPGEPEASYGRWPFPPMSRTMTGAPRSFFVTAVR
jgi:methyltransferase (TIGR00027 family)